MKKYDAIVVGSGIGGMAAGVLMAHQGKKVLMVEKHDCLGGRVSAYKKGEFNFDLGVHIISRGNKGPLGEVLRRVGAENNAQFTPACLTGKQAPENLCAACAGNPPQELRAIPKAAARLSPIHTARHSQSSAVR